ncbi:uncharacterized protein LOC111022972 [Momordica charantia]|uniref:Uncharacterized protein LOC111022972 n=1 Tax=Momordica charantia TaxID=3673 RepID=A0A6J1DQW1_MOMCH|nr:uncharacterized protein LOC111022972 [Momordica charantia]
MTGKSRTHLMTILQEESESLREFVGRFMLEKIKVPDYSDDVARMTFMVAVNNLDLIQSYALQPTHTYSEAIQRARQHMHAKDMLKAKHLQYQTMTSKYNRSRSSDSYLKKDHSNKGDHKRANQDNRPSLPRTVTVPNRRLREFDQYTPLNVPIAEILANIESRDLHTMLEKPGKMKLSLDKRSRNKYCRFHRDHDHDTSQCYRDQIEDLIRKCHLKKYVGKKDACSWSGKRKYDRMDRGDEDPSSTPKKRDEGKRPVVINTIFSGPSGRQSGNKRKALVREAQHEVNSTSHAKPVPAITFHTTDSEGIHIPHNDALVIAPIIDNVRVKRVLVDGGASTNVLSFSTYLALGLERTQLK